MRTINRLLVFAGELGVLVLGFVLSVGLATACAGYFNSRELFFVGADVAQLVFLFGLVLTAVGFAGVLRKHRVWKLEYDAAGWALARTERRFHPTRARFKRIAIRVLVWMPTMISALVVFFYPIATHLVRPGSFNFNGYRVRIPWTFTLIVSPHPSPDFVSALFTTKGRGRFGMTPFLVIPFWLTQQRLSFLSFESQPDQPGDLMMERARRSNASEILKRDFRTGDHAFTCVQYRPSYRSPIWPGDGFEWIVECATPLSVNRRKLYARFSGHEEDLPSFYRIIETVVISGSPMQSRRGA